MKRHYQPFAQSRWSLVLMSTLMLSGTAWSEDQSDAALAMVPGSRVRVLAETVVRQRFQGTLLESGRETVLISTDGGQTVRVPWRVITELEVSAGRHRQTWRGVAIGAATGAVLSVVLPKCVNEGCSTEFSGEFAALGAVSGGMWGALIGSCIHRDRWRAVPLDKAHVEVMPMGGRGWMVSLSIPF